MKTRLKIITPDALSDFNANFERYITGIAFNDHEVLDELYDERNFRESNIEFDYKPLIQSGDFKVTDYKNIKIFYDTFKNLTPVQATQERLWVSLTLNHYMDYLKYRAESYFNELTDSEKKAKAVKGLKAAILFTQGQKRSLFVGRLSRLWWSGFLTYDKEHENPYHLTKFFAEEDYSGRAILYFSSNYTANRSLSHGILSALKDFNNNIEKVSRTKHLVPVTKYFNTLGGGSVIDLYTRDDVYNLTEHFLTEMIE